MSTQNISEPLNADQQFQLVLHELKELAAAKLARESPGITLQPTALVHEVYIRLQKTSHLFWNDERHFIAIAAGAMQHVIVDHMRKKKSIKAGKGLCRVELCEVETGDATAPAIEDLHEALEQLHLHDARSFELIQLRFFGGMTIEEAAATVGISPTQAKRDWAYAKAWLEDRLNRTK